MREGIYWVRREEVRREEKKEDVKRCSYYESSPA